ncbi:uncharacterized protein TNCV_4791661 [Trichonephila clavipes]|nr:uncharacterized protein TNCV_4791661 [Trichonephila clavipes]
MACKIKLLESKATTGFLVLLGEQGNQAVLDWVMKEGLIPSRYECPKCKKDMRLVERKGTIDGFEWRCRVQSKENPHLVCRSNQRSVTAQGSMPFGSAGKSYDAPDIYECNDPSRHGNVRHPLLRNSPLSDGERKHVPPN